MAFRVFFAVAAFYDPDIDQIDAKIAFLYNFINQLVYVKILKGIETDANQDIIYKLLKILYDLKQSPCLWYKRLSNFLLQKLGLSWINTDHSNFVTKSGLNDLLVSMFVDDIKVMILKESGII